VPNPTQPESLRLSVIKSNLDRFPAPVGVAIGEIGVTFGEAPEAPAKTSAVEDASDFLQGLLTSGPVKAADVYAEGEAAGLSESALRRAKKALKVESHKGRWLVLGAPSVNPLVILAMLIILRGLTRCSRYWVPVFAHLG